MSELHDARPGRWRDRAVEWLERREAHVEVGGVRMTDRQYRAATFAYRLDDQAARDLELIDDAFCDILQDQHRHLTPPVERSLTQAIDRLRDWRERHLP